MNQIAIILYSNPKDPTKSVIPNNKKIVLECDKLEILEDIMHKLQSLLTDGEQGIPILYVKKEMLTPLGDGMYSYRLKYSSEVTNDGIYKALVKMVLDLVPKSELDHFRNIIVWINGPNLAECVLCHSLRRGKILYATAIGFVFQYSAEFQ